MIEQVAIACTGVVAIALTQSRQPELQRYACLFGLAGQPFWVYAAVTAQQWGILIVSLLYTAAWASGVYNHWIRRQR